MKRPILDRRSLALLFLAALGAANPAGAGICSLDPAPGATLLLPYFEVGIADFQNIPTTLVRVQNASEKPTLAHLTLWTQWGQPSVDIDFYFTGYDVVSFNLGDFFNGNVPITADRQNDPTDTISPHGSFPELDGTFPVCGNFFPFFVNPVIRGANLERVRDGHTGQPVSSLPANHCLGPDPGDGVARGYLTLDVVSSCSTAFAFDVGYFIDGGAGIALNQNRLFGDWQIVEPSRGIAYGGPLVSIEADSSFTPASTFTGYTFFGAVATGDNREPLGAVWDFRYAAGADAGDPFTSTELIVWRDPTSKNFPNQGFVCGVGPDWAPLDEQQVLCFDEQENAIELCGGATDCFPLATQKVSFDQGPLAVPFSRGFCQVDLNNPNDAPTGDRDFPATGPTVQQAFVSVVRVGANGIGAASPASVIRHACAPPAAFAGDE